LILKYYKVVEGSWICIYYFAY